MNIEKKEEKGSLKGSRKQINFSFTKFLFFNYFCLQTLVIVENLLVFFHARFSKYPLSSAHRVFVISNKDSELHPKGNLDIKLNTIPISFCSFVSAASILFLFSQAKKITWSNFLFYYFSNLISSHELPIIKERSTNRRTDI